MHFKFSALFTLSLLLLAAPAHAAGGKAFTDAKSAGEAYQIQGEYSGEGKTRDGSKRFGAQIIALGNNKYRLVGYHGGLPGDGWNRGDEIVTSEGEAVNGVISLAVEEADVEIGNGKIKVTVEGQIVAELKKVDRKSPTLGMKAPEGAVVLFDGTSADKFDNGKLVDGKWLGATNVSTKKKLGDHQLHIEFRTPFMPDARGQGRGNSGVYIQGRYECQVLDSFGLDGKDNECGGIYKVAVPRVNMCFPPLSWQTYDIDFKAAKYEGGQKVENARATIRHNGVIIHENLELPNATPGRHGEGPGPESLFLQDHGNPVVFRNIWVVEK